MKTKVHLISRAFFLIFHLQCLAKLLAEFFKRFKARTIGANQVYPQLEGHANKYLNVIKIATGTQFALNTVFVMM